jgi:formylglycine-generating enzyme required for sulfatase activity
LIRFSTQPGNVALDGTGRNSPYSGPLVKRIGRRGEDVLTVLTDVRNEVLAATGDKQVPWENHALRARFYFNPAAKATTLPQPTPAPAPMSDAGEVWNATKDTTSIPVLEAFIARYKDTFYTELARARVAELKKQQMAVVAPPKAPEPAPQAKAAMATPAPPAPRCDGVETQVGNEQRCLKPKDSFRDCMNCPEIAGRFTMGSPSNEPQRSKDEALAQVSIAAPFAVGKYAVTFDEWDACAAESGCNGYKPDHQGWGRGKRPVINVSWDNAKAYLKWLSAKTDNAYRLLSEAEREYVTRAGTTTPFWWGSSIAPKQANYNDNYTYADGGTKAPLTFVMPRHHTVPVDSFEPNPWGIYNVHGNVWDWTEV